MAQSPSPSGFEALAKPYLEDIRIGKTAYAWMISRDGTELYCPVPGHIGHSVFDNCRDFPSILVMAEKMLKGEQGSSTYTFDKIRGSQVENVRKHAVYMPIRLGNTFWSIVVASSEDEIIAHWRISGTGFSWLSACLCSAASCFPITDSGPGLS
jgi:hypothetical protein